jgi:signal transduction histidine kinase
MTRTTRNPSDSFVTSSDPKRPRAAFDRAEPDHVGTEQSTITTMMAALATIASTLTTVGKPFVIIKLGNAPATAVFPNSPPEYSIPQRAVSFSLERQPSLADRLNRGEHVVVGTGSSRKRPGADECVVLFPIIHRQQEVVFLLGLALDGGEELAPREVKLMQVLCHLAAPLLSAGRGPVDSVVDDRGADNQLEQKAAYLQKKLRRLEQAKRDVEAIDHQMRALLLSNITHELRTPLVAIRGYTRMILEGRAGGLNSTQREYLSVVEDNVARLVSLTGNLARLTASQQLRTESFDLCGLLRDCIATISVSCAEKGIQLASLVPAGRFEIIGDREKLGQVLSSLLANALKYADRGGSIRVEFHRGKQGEATIKVQDTGAGIPKDLVDRLFDSCAPGAPRPELPNSIGHGLSLAHDIVCLHGGRMSVSSKMGKGSVFAITLPAIKTDPEQAV